MCICWCWSHPCLVTLMLFAGYNHVLLSSPLLLKCEKPVVLQLRLVPAFANRCTVVVMLLICLPDVFPLSRGVLGLFGVMVSHVGFEFHTPSQILLILLFQLSAVVAKPSNTSERISKLRRWTKCHISLAQSSALVLGSSPGCSSHL